MLFCSMLSRSYDLSSPHSSAEETAGNSLSADSLNARVPLSYWKFSIQQGIGLKRDTTMLRWANIDFHEDDLFYSQRDDDFLRFELAYYF